MSGAPQPRADDLDKCPICGFGYFLHSGDDARCDHCDSPRQSQFEAEIERQQMSMPLSEVMEMLAQHGITQDDIDRRAEKIRKLIKQKQKEIWTQEQE